MRILGFMGLMVCGLRVFRVLGSSGIRQGQRSHLKGFKSSRVKGSWGLKVIGSFRVSQKEQGKDEDLWSPR